MKWPILFAMLLLSIIARSQHTIVYWDFNSETPDGSLSTGTLKPRTGNGFLSFTGTTETGFSSAGTNGGSGDTVPSDNSGLNSSHYPSQEHGDRSSGLEIGCSLNGFKDIVLGFDLRSTSTASRYQSIQFSVDSGITWTEAFIYSFPQAASNWDNDVRIDLKEFQELNDAHWIIFRLLTCFEPGTNRYKAVGNGNYSASGSLRYDRIRISGEHSEFFRDVVPPIPTSVVPLNRSEVLISFNERLNSSSITENFTTGIPGEFAPSFVDSNKAIVLHFLYGFPQGVHHTLKIFGIRDISGNQMMDTVLFPVFLNAARPALRITEIMYNNPGEDDLEYLEFYNTSNTPVSLESFYLQGIELVLPQISIQAKGYLLLAKNKRLCEETFHRSFLEWENGSLSNSGESIILRNQLGEVIDSVFYDNTGSWIKGPNGNGPSLELANPGFDGTDPGSWQSGLGISGIADHEILYGTPGSGYSKNRVSFSSDTIEISEGIGKFSIPILIKPSDNEAVWIKLSIAENDDMGLASNIIQIRPNTGNEFEITLNDDSIYEPSEYFTIHITASENAWLNGFSEIVVRIIDNDHQLPRLCISEWMSQNTKSVQDEWGEYEPWIELYNPNEYPINLGSYALKTCTTTTDSCTYSALPQQQIPALGFHVFYMDSDLTQGTDHLALWLPKKSGSIEVIDRANGVIITSRVFQSSFSNKSTEAPEPCGDSLLTNPYPTPGWAGTGNGLERTEYKAFKIYPNPIQNGVVRLPVRDDYFVFNSKGYLVSNCLQINELDVEDFTPGVYFVRSVSGMTSNFIIP